MTSVHGGRLRTFLLLCLFGCRPIEGWMNMHGDQVKTGTPIFSEVQASAAGGSMEVEATTTQRYVQRLRRGTPSANVSRQKVQANALPKGFVCPYKVISEDRASHRSICFRTLDSNFHCDQRNCKAFKSRGSLVANVLRNSSVLLQWLPPAPQLKDLKGFNMNCSWNGTFTRFLCDSVQLGISCRDYLFSNVHENVKYTVCVQTLYTNRTSLEECVEFTVEPLGMQDIVIAMTAVGGSICVMLVIICLLVAYITENLMHPNFSHPSAKRGP
ncbi:fibronectin type III domain-containing protein 10 [Pelobates fuscus]|uniref:fibronectin type III domain-containing protein 10 n=1 Tax=Pelobates fuscus TaxID=191477 RepID=UPI002FE44F30